ADGSTTGHALYDLGADEFTKGRPHPMIEPAIRDDALTEALSDAKVGVVLVDVVIGLGSHDDPAGHLTSLVAGHQSLDQPVIIASVTGTEADPQIRSVQVAKLEAAGIHVAPTNADAAGWSLTALTAGKV
ncbi:MAG: oxidoreductase, partial [Alphaproteobacteria bacterium]|nr:oxidoreductase [Alphaproteobacteria bacterium]